MKTRYILGIVVSVIMAAGSYLFIEMCLKARTSYFFSIMSSSDKFSNSYGRAIEITEQAALLSLPFILYFIVLYILAIKSVKTRKAKTISIIGLALSSILLIWDILTLSSPSHISFDEVGYAWIAYALLMAILFFAIIKEVDTDITSMKSNDEIVDDII